MMVVRVEDDQSWLAIRESCDQRKSLELAAWDALMASERALGASWREKEAL